MQFICCLFFNPADQSSSMINLIASDQLLRNQSPSVSNPRDLSERLIEARFKDYQLCRKFPSIYSVKFFFRVTVFYTPKP